MTELADRNRATVLRLMDALNICDEPAIRAILAPDARWWVAGVGTMDLETLMTQLRQMIGTAKVAQTQIVGTTAEGERVAVESRGNFEFEDGRVYRNTYHHLFVVEEGRVTAVREYLDLLEAQRAFGTVVTEA